MAVINDSGEQHQLMDLKALERVSTQLRSQTIGCQKILDTPFGQRYLVYADFSASGRALAPIEDYIRDEVLQVYGNVHSQSTWTARQSSYFREEARDIARNYLRGDHEIAIIFTGAGATGAISTFMAVMARQKWLPSNPSFLKETRWHTFKCELCDGLQLDGHASAKAHLNSEKHKANVRCTDLVSTDKATLVIFLIDPTLHHSAMLPMRELAKENSAKFRVEFLDLAANVSMDVGALRSRLDAIKVASEVWQNELSIITWCVINGCSNVTGAKAAVKDLASLIHCYPSTYIAVDMASALGSMPIHLSSSAGDYLDVAFFSPHKLLGGPNTSGILAIRKELLDVNVPPGIVGGGVVRFVSRDLQLYELALEQREEAGTPNIISCIRTGMVLKLASQIPYHVSMAREYEHMAMCLRLWCRNKRIQILGPITVMETKMSCSSEDLRTGAAAMEKDFTGVRKSVISLMIKYGNHLESTLTPGQSEQALSISECVNEGVSVTSYRNRSSHAGGLYLHHNFVCAVLNDVFGIQARPGCACAGPLAHDLLGMGNNLVQVFLNCLEETGCEVLRPGFCRITLHYTMSIDDVELIAQAVNWVAQFGWKLLPYYTFNANSGEWTQNVAKPDHFRKWLSHMTLTPSAGVVWGSNASVAEKIDTGDSAELNGRKKDAKKLAGAVAMPGMNQEALIAMRSALAKRSAAPKKAAAEEKGPISAPRRTSSIDETPNKTKSVAEIRKMLEKKATAASQNPTGQEKLKTVKALASKFERSNSLKSQSVAESPCIRSPSLPEPPMRRPSIKGGDQTKPIRSKSPPPAPASVAPAIVGDHLLPVTKTAVAVTVEENESVGPTFGNCLTNEIDEVRRAIARQSQKEIPCELQDFYDRANELIDGLKPGCGTANALTHLSRQGLCPPLPQQYAQLLWFALPGDAVYSLGIFAPVPNEGEPAVCMQPSDPGYPLWFTSTGSTTRTPKDLQRPIDSIFETVSYPVRIMKKSELDGFAPAVGDGIIAWINGTAEHEVTKKTIIKNQPSPTAVTDPRRLTPAVVRHEPVAAREATSAVVDSSSNACNSIVAEAGSLDQASPNSLLKDIASAGGSEPDENSIGPTTYTGSALTPVIPRFLRRKLGEAVNTFGMIAEGDRILVGLSGGKDSLSMLHLLVDLQKRCPVKFEIGAATVNPMTIEYDPLPLVEYLADLRIPYYMLSYPIMALAAEKMQGHSLCAFCARMKRGMLYTCMKNNNYNKLALGQHMDDVAESFLMSAFYNGSLNTMKANYITIIPDYDEIGGTKSAVVDGQPCTINIIRPLIFVREKELAQFAQSNHLPVIADNCPACFRAPKERLRMKHLLAAQEFEHPATLHNIKKAVMPLMAINRSDLAKSPEAIDEDDEPMCSNGFCKLPIKSDLKSE